MADYSIGAPTVIQRLQNFSTPLPAINPGSVGETVDLHIGHDNAYSVQTALTLSIVT